MRKAFALLALLLIFPLLTCAFAQTYSLTWSAYLPIQLASDTTLQSSQPWVFGSFVWGTNSILLTDTYIGSGTPIPTLNITSSNANITLNQLALSGTTDLTISSNGSSTVQLYGFGQAPDSVTVNGTQVNTWNYSSSSDVFSLSPIVGSQDVVLDYAVTNNSLMAIGVVALVIAMTALAFGIIAFTRRRNRGENEREQTY